MSYTLPEMLAALYQAEINAGMEAEWDAGFHVWIDEARGSGKAHAYFTVGEGAHDYSTWPMMWRAVLRWLAEEVIKDFENLEDRAPVDAGCIQCTAGTVPNRLNTGLCAYHIAKEIIREPVPPTNGDIRRAALQEEAKAISRTLASERAAERAP